MLRTVTESRNDLGEGGATVRYLIQGAFLNQKHHSIMVIVEILLNYMGNSSIPPIETFFHKNFHEGCVYPRHTLALPLLRSIILLGTLVL